tara:strand:+ start:2978 stop:3673 length:696 start_codon:yes stop_codon:yes gene_type:complete
LEPSDELESGNWFHRAWAKFSAELPGFRRAFQGAFVGTVAAYAVIGSVVLLYLNQWDARLALIAETSKEYKRGTDEKIDQVLEEIRRTADANELTQRDVSDVRERVARLENQSEITTQILLTADTARVERQFLPVLPRTISTEVGGPNVEPEIGFEPAIINIPFPRSVDERLSSIDRLKRQHLQILHSFSQPVFDDRIHALEVTGQQIVTPDGKILLQLTSTVVRRLEPDD